MAASMFPMTFGPPWWLECQLEILREFVISLGETARTAELQYEVTANRLSRTRRLMDVVRYDDTVGAYVGISCLERTAEFADLFGDFNPAHMQGVPLFGDVIAHGMDGGLQLWAAIKSYLDHDQLVPTSIQFGFSRPVYPRGAPDLLITIQPTESGSLVAKVHAVNGGESVKAITAFVTLEPGKLSEREWVTRGMAFGVASALLASTWQCIYVGHVFNFASCPADLSTLTARVRGRGYKGSGRFGFLGAELDIDGIAAGRATVKIA